MILKDLGTTQDISNISQQLWAMVDLISSRLSYLSHIKFKFDGYELGYGEHDGRPKINYDFCGLLWQRLYGQAVRRCKHNSHASAINLSNMMVRVGSPVRKDSYPDDQDVCRSQRTYEIRKPKTDGGILHVVCTEVEDARSLLSETAYRQMPNPLEWMATEGIHVRFVRDDQFSYHITPACCAVPRFTIPPGSAIVQRRRMRHELMLRR